MMENSELVRLEVLPAERRGLGEAKPMGMVVLTSEDVSKGETVSVPAEVARVLLRWQRESSQGEFATWDECRELIERAQQQAAKDKLLRLISRRDYAKHELRQRLLQEGFDARVADQAIERLANYGLIDDARYTETFIRSKVIAGWGIERIVRELGMRGIDVSNLDGWPYDYIDPEEELTRAEAVAAKKCASGPKPYAKLVRFLVGRGFSHYVSCEAARKYA